MWRMEFWSGRRGSNSQLSAWEADTLPLSYARSMNGRECGEKIKEVVAEVSIQVAFK